MQLIQKVLEKNKKAIVLVPEISLTPQMTERFFARFGDCIAILHSKLTNQERFIEWEKINNEEVSIVIGARSAIFAPVKNLGIVIIDEEHDSSYKAENKPTYNAKDIALYICKKNNIPLVLGSATPDINTFYKAQNGKIELLKLTKRANNSSLPSVSIVDLKQELANGNRTIFSEKLYGKIEDNLANKKQTILFLNRRGFSTFVMCRDCGYTVKCRRCNINLTYHLKEDILKCHYCGYESNNIKICPVCKSKSIKYFGIGTQKIEQEINKCFTNASTIRMDIDTITKENTHEIILNKFKNENIDILIGTQMIVKGHHFPKVTLVGVIVADSGLNIEDYRANERTFQILTQVAGRAGREGLLGEVIIQTYNPTNFAIECAKHQNYDLFYNTEIAIRKQLNYPPFCDIIIFNISSTQEDEVIKVAEIIHKLIKEFFDNAEKKVFFSNPLPSPVTKIKNKFRWRIILKCKLNNKIVENVNNVLTEFYNMKYKKTIVTADVNPNNMM